MFKRILALLIALILFTGCGVNIKQEGNKIYTDVSKDEAYQFSDAALKTKGYKIQEESKINYYIVANPKYNKTFTVENAKTQEIKVNVGDGEKPKETVVTIMAYVNGKIDKEKSTEIAQAAVTEIIKELDNYGKFTINEKGEHIYQVATIEQVFKYIDNYFKDNNIPVTNSDAENGLIEAQESTATSIFNEPLNAEIKVLTDETKKVSVIIDTQLKGNYDIRGNQAYTEKFIQNFLNYLENYPIVEKGLRYPFKYISFDKALMNTQSALKDSKFLIAEIDNQNFIITAQKDNINISTTFTEINNNIAVNLEAFSESIDLDTTKEALNEIISNELNTIRDNLAKYQTIHSSTKLFTSINKDTALRYTGRALTALGYKYRTNKADMTISAVSRTNSNMGHFIMISDLGSDGISLDIHTMYNTKNAKAAAIAKKANDQLLNALAKHDKEDLK